MSKEWPVVVRFVVNGEDRRAIARYYGNTGLAPLKDCRRWLELAAYGDLAAIAGETPDESA